MKKSMEEAKPLITSTFIVPLYDYKLPLRPVESGFGYMGTVSGLADGSAIQCHICGRLVAMLKSHLTKKHGVKVTEYREKFGIAALTKLISKNAMLRYSDALKKRIDSGNFPLQSGWTTGRRNGGGGWKNKGRKLSLETKNKRGMCPDQLIDKIHDATKYYGYVPSKLEFLALYKDKYLQPIQTTFGSWSSALRVAGYTPKKQTRKTYHKPYSEDELIGALQVFKEEYGREPRLCEFGMGFLPTNKPYYSMFGTVTRAKQIAYGISE